MLLFFALLFAITGVTAANACSHDYARADLLEMPTGTFFIECRRILGNDEPWTWNAIYDPRRYPGARVTLYKTTEEQDVADFAEALHGDPNAIELVDHYQALRAALSGHLAKWLNLWDQSEYYHSNPDRFGKPEPFIFGDDNSRWDSIPAEFAEYLRGAAAYHNAVYDNGDWDTAIQHFETVLALPVGQRQYRSTWAAFMLGKAWTQKDPSRAAQYFQQTRDLAAKGFHDSLALADASVGWEAHALLKAGDAVTALHRYAELSSDSGVDLREACSQALAAPSLDPGLVEDELSRRLITAWVISYPRETEKCDKWLHTLDEYRPQGKVEDADRMAWFCYQRGDFSATQRWLDHCDPDAPYAQWVCAKMLMREGKLEEAAALLDSLAVSFPTDTTARVQSPVYGAHIYEPEYAHDLVVDDLGFAREKQGKYGEALAAYIASGWDDRALKLAERVMTVDELQQFVDAPITQPGPHADRRMYLNEYSMPGATRILVGRYARAGAWDKAAALGNQYAADVKQWLDTANDAAKPVHDRAQALFDVGRTIREHGPAFFNPELVPYLPAGDANAPPGSRQARIYQSQQPYPRMNHFKYVAADYMWQCAEMLPNNDVLCARALYTGGTYLENKDPESADRFYKALVRRNPNLQVAQEADQLRWFPKTFAETVLYQPLPKHWYGRKRNLAVPAALACAAALGAALIATRARRVAAQRTNRPENNAT